MGMHKSGRNDHTTPGASCDTIAWDRAMAEASGEKYLKDYIQRNTDAGTNTFGGQWPPGAVPNVEEKQKMTFDEWVELELNNNTHWHKDGFWMGKLQACWKAAQENV